MTIPRTAHPACLSVAVALFTLLCRLPSEADGGVVRIREAQGPFLVTIFTPAEPLAGTPTEVAVMVQQLETGQVLTDAAVDLSFAPPASAAVQPGEVLCAPSSSAALPASVSAGQPITRFPASHAQASNKLLSGTSVRLRAVGDWHLVATVRHKGEETNVACVLPVHAASSRLAWLWPYLALPPLAIALFAVNQWLRMRMARERLAFSKPSADQLAGAAVALATGQMELLPKGTK